MEKHKKSPRAIPPPATEIDWLRWFHANADFGSASDDVRVMMKEAFMEQTGKRMPQGYRYGVEGDGE